MRKLFNKRSNLNSGSAKYGLLFSLSRGAQLMSGSLQFFSIFRDVETFNPRDPKRKKRGAYGTSYCVHKVDRSKSAGAGGGRRSPKPSDNLRDAKASRSSQLILLCMANCQDDQGIHITRSPGQMQRKKGKTPGYLSWS